MTTKKTYYYGTGKRKASIARVKIFNTNGKIQVNGKSIKDLNKYEKEQFAQLHSRIANPLYIFCFALIPLIILKFSKKPGDSFLIPISIVSIIA